MSTEIVVSGARDQRVAAIASQQRGRVSRKQLLAAGLSGGQITGLCRSHRMFRLHAGVYAVGHFAPVPLGAETAALLATRPGAMLSHHTAARLWGLNAVPEPELIHVLVDPRWAGRRPGLRIHRSRLIAAADRRLRERLPVTSPERSLLDVAPEIDERALERAYDQAIVNRLTTATDVAALLARASGHPGRRRLAEVLAADRTTTLTRSEAEEMLLALIREADLPRPRVNQRLHGSEVDFHWPDAGLVVEVDGFAFHSSRIRFEDDRTRDTRLQTAGLEVQRVTWRQLEREPFAVIARIAQALARRSPRR